MNDIIACYCWTLTQCIISIWALHFFLFSLRHFSSLLLWLIELIYQEIKTFGNFITILLRSHFHKYVYTHRFFWAARFFFVHSFQLSLFIRKTLFIMVDFFFIVWFRCRYYYSYIFISQFPHRLLQILITLVRILIKSRKMDSLYKHDDFDAQQRKLSMNV